MAQLLVHIDSELKRRLKAHLAANGTTLKVWVTEQARRTLENEEVLAPVPTPVRRPKKNQAKKARPAARPVLPEPAEILAPPVVVVEAAPTPAPEPAPVPAPQPPEPTPTVHPQAGVFRPTPEFNVEED